MMMLEQALLLAAIVIWGLLWGYSTLLVMLVFMKETDSLYAYPMRVALDRFVESFGCGWLRTLHNLQLSQLRTISYSMFGVVTAGVALTLFLTGGHP